MKKLPLLIMAFAMGLLFSANVNAQGTSAKDHEKSEKNKNIIARVDEDMKKLTPYLNLNAEQAEKMKKSLKDHYVNKDVIADENKDKAERLKKAKAEDERHEAELKGFLSAEQIEKLHKWHENPQAPKKAEK